MKKSVQPEMSIDEDGDTVWRLNGNLHREDGPAIEWANGDKAWCVNNNLHRTAGPAVEYADGHATWHLEGIRLSFEEWLAKTTGVTDEEKVMFKLQYG